MATTHRGSLIQVQVHSKHPNIPNYIPLILGSSVLITSLLSSVPPAPKQHTKGGTRLQWVNAKENVSFGSSTIGSHRRQRNGGNFRKNIPIAVLTMQEPPGGRESRPESKAGSRTQGMKPELRPETSWEIMAQIRGRAYEENGADGEQAPSLPEGLCSFHPLPTHSITSPYLYQPTAPTNNTGYH